MRNLWLDGIFGVVVGDALGCPVEFHDRAALQEDPITGMQGYGTFNLPAGSWTDDSSMTLATLDSLREKRGVELHDIMERFFQWLDRGAYTPYGEVFDVGAGTRKAVVRYLNQRDVSSCGGKGVLDNGNGSLMRIMPLCLYCYEQERTGGLSRREAVDLIHRVSGLTHDHLRSKIACGLYYFMAVRILEDGSRTPLSELLQEGITQGWRFYTQAGTDPEDLTHYGHLLDLAYFASLGQSQIRSGGYVVDTMEAAVWCLLTTNSYAACVLKAVNLGADTDTVAAIAGGLAGLYYGAESIPQQWMETIARREWISELCRQMA